MINIPSQFGETMRIVSVIASVVLVLYLGVCGLLFSVQRSMIYFPQPRSHAEGSVLMTLPVGAGTVNVSTRPQEGPDALLYFGGNAEDVSWDVPNLARAFPGRAIYALHYPGYGGSSGTPSEKSIFAAALALFDKVVQEHPNVVVVGRSLGSGAAVWLASERPVTRLVLVTPFDRLSDVASAQYPFLPVRLLLRDQFDSGKYAHTVSAPTRIVVAANDELVPRSSSDRLSREFRKDQVSVVIVPDVGHNTIQDSHDYWTFLGAVR
jgi:pimeloyl-ACP methyl ester carboxylesterase